MYCWSLAWRILSITLLACEMSATVQLTPPYNCQNIHRTGETDSWRAQTRPCVHQDPGERSSDPLKTDSDFPVSVQVCLQEKHGSAVACCRFEGNEWGSGCMGPFQWGHHYLHYLHHSLASGQTTGREHSSAHQQKIGLKIYWAWSHPSEQDPVFPSVRVSHPEASINLLSTSIRGQTEWKPQSHKTNKLIIWTQPCLTQWNYESCHVGPPKMDRSWWRVL